MTSTARLTLGLSLAGILLAGPALASPCSDKIAGLNGRAKSEASDSISAASSGKSVAAQREGEGQTGTGGQTDTGTASPEKSAEAGKGGEHAQQARVAMEEALAADKKGDTAGCEAAVARAEKLLDAKP
ncbi:MULTISPECIES: hypothetical protein [Methylobacteriaceae]|uniref:hypothetical protein n=1 Tax=Methylobacteriaceae TaxID=119045 RepID=UPI00074F88FD|nr:MULTISPECIES: hypothetical protein [Methylobacteriaceae]AMB47866.1 hypothetical protein Y590_23180 [Methylobacterium sp. AMS5]TFZ58316.1 hypothetical protein E4V01_11300 [Methylorubrum sp. Q1]